MRFYNTPSGLMPSVSTILASTTPLSERIKLIKKAESWDKKREALHNRLIEESSINQSEESGELLTSPVLLQEYDKDKDSESWFNHCEEARNRGTLVHEYVKRFLERPRMDRYSLIDVVQKENPHLINYWRGLERELNGMGEAIGLEFPVVHPTLFYAGRLDAFVYINGKRVLLDVKTFGGYQIEDKKTGKIIEIDTWSLFSRAKKIGNVTRPKTLNELWHSWIFIAEKVQRTILQLTAYRMALELQGYEIDEICILIVNPKGGTQRIIIPNEQEFRDLCTEKWIERCRQFQKLDQKPDVTQIATMNLKEKIQYLNPREYFKVTDPDIKPLDFLPRDLLNRES